MTGNEFGSGWRRVLRDVLRRERRTLLALAGWSLVEAVPALVSGRLVAAAVDSGFLAGKPAVGFAWLAAMAGAVLVGALGTRHAYLKLAAVVEPFRDELARLAVTGALVGGPAPGARSNAAAVARLTRQVELVRESFASVAMSAQTFVVITASALVGLVTLVPLAIVLVLPPLIVALAIFVRALPAIIAAQRASLLAEEQLSEASTMLTDGLRDVVACGGEERVAALAGRHVDAHARASNRLARLTAACTLSLGVGGWLPVLLILATAPWLTAHGAGIGVILGALTYVLQSLQPALETLITSVGGNGLWLAASLGRLVDAGGLPAAPTASAPRRPDGYRIELQHVTFGYGVSGQAVLDDLDLVIAEGSHLAVVGPSGTGKSTLAAVLAGLLEPQHGRVVIGGVDMRTVRPAELARRCALVPQEAYVFAGTVGANIRYLRPGVPERLRPDAVGPRRVARALDELGIWPLVDRLGGLDAEIEPSSLSAGERQLITLARAYLSPAPVVVLDEATCHLDPMTEARVEAAFAARAGTLVVIAHRISSALRADQVLVMDAGRVDVGTHDELLTASALYRDLAGHWQWDNERIG